MKHVNKSDLKEQAVQLYLNGNNYADIAKIIGRSRNYVSNLIKEDDRVTNYKNQRIVKLYKNANDSRITVFIPLDYWEKIGVSKNPNISENIQMVVDEQTKRIIIEKHKI